jgi:smad nuclear-interacting protein 1
MRRLERSAAAGPPLARELPNWGIQALYNDRQLVVQNKLTQYFLPFDSALPDGIWRLFLFSDAGGERAVALEEEATLIGRERFCSVRLPHRSVSRQHCALQFRRVRPGPGSAAAIVPYVFDLGSTHGTFVNGARVQPSRFVELRPRDRLAFGAAAAVLMRASAQAVGGEDASL